MSQKQLINELQLYEMKPVKTKEDYEKILKLTNEINKNYQYIYNSLYSTEKERNDFIRDVY